MSHKDRSGEIITVHSSYDMYMSDFMYFINSLANKTASYQYAFFKSILDNLFNVDEKLELSFDFLSNSFSKMYWNLVSKYKLPQYQNGRMSLMEKEVYQITGENNLLDGIDFDSLKEEIKNIYLDKTKNVICKDVLGALHRALKKLSMDIV